MSSLSAKSKTTRCAAAVAATLSVGGLVLSNTQPASADPKQQSALVGVGSDTTQDVLNALAGFNNGINYTPIQSSAATFQRQITSFDATPAGSCITPRAPGATFDRPNGSTAGRRALSRAIDGGLYGAAGPCGSAGKVITGLVDFARSSAGPSSAGSGLTYLPFGRDALSFGYYANGVTPVTNLSSAQLTSLYSTGPQTINGVNIVPCQIQIGSGTRQSFLTAVGVSDSTSNTATAACGGTIQENDANGLKARALTMPNTQLIIGFSAANFIAQSNGVSPSQLPAGDTNFGLGSIDALGLPFNGTGSSLTPSATFYNNTTYGRNVYNVVATSRATGFGNDDLKSLFVGSTSAICSGPAQTTVNRFGFLSIPTCGSTTLTGPLVA